MKNYIIEAIGTFFLVLVIGLTLAVDLALAPIAIGEFGSLTDSPFNTTTVLVPDPPPKATSAKSPLVNRYLAK